MQAANAGAGRGEGGGAPAADVAAVDAAYLTEVLRRAGHTGAEVLRFSREPAGGKSYGGGQVHRFHLTLAGAGPGEAGRAGAGRPAGHPPASLILKEVREIASQANDPGFARREVACYEHDIFAGLGDRLVVPRAYSLDVRPDGCWIWMEDLSAAFEVPWTPSLFAGAVRNLAELHARWWDRAPELAGMAFLRRRAQAMYDGVWSPRIAANCAAIEGHPHERAIARVFTPERRRLLVQLSTAGDLVYGHLDRLPQTLLHHDVWLPNLGHVAGAAGAADAGAVDAAGAPSAPSVAGDKDAKTVLIDWSYTGPGTPGADLSQGYALLVQMWGAATDDRPLLAALHDGLAGDWRLPIDYEQVLAGYELAFCLRPAHGLGGPVLGGTLSGRATMVGSDDIEVRLDCAETVFRRIERGVRRLDEPAGAGR